MLSSSRGRKSSGRRLWEGKARVTAEASSSPLLRERVAQRATLRSASSPPIQLTIGISTDKTLPNAACTSSKGSGSSSDRDSLLGLAAVGQPNDLALRSLPTSTMIRRPPTSILVSSSDVEELKAARRKAQEDSTSTANQQKAATPLQDQPDSSQHPADRRAGERREMTAAERIGLTR